MTKGFFQTNWSAINIIRTILAAVLVMCSYQIFSQAPTNDAICNAIPITCGSTVAGTTINATNTGTGEALNCGGWNQNTPGVWYSFVGDGNTVTFSLCGTTHDSQIAIFTGTCTSPVCYVANDDNGPACSGLPSSLAFNSVVGQTYWVKIFSWTTLTPQFNFNLSVTCTVPPPPPTNDFICNAIAVTCGSSTAGTTTGSTNFGTNESNSCGGYTQNTPGVWYKITGNGQIITASLCGGTNDSELAIFQSASGDCNAATCLGSNDDNGPACTGLSASISWSSVSGTTYFIKVFSYSTLTPNFNFTLAVNCTAAPPNNNCAQAIAISSLPFTSGAQTTVGATNDLPAMSGCGGSGNNNVWYTLIGTGTSITVSTTTASFNSEIVIFSGTCGGLTYVTCNDGTGNTASTTFCSTMGTTYYISVGSGGNGSSTGTFNLDVTAAGISGTFNAGDMVWRGSNTNWFSLTNWAVFNGTGFAAATSVPQPTSNVFITPTGGCTLANPVISGLVAATTNNLTILPGGNLQMSASGSPQLYVSGNWWNDGNWNSGAGTVIFNGSTLQEAGGVPVPLGYNQFGYVRTEMTGPGIILSTPFNITTQLDMISGNIQTFTNNPLLLGEVGLEPCMVNWTSGSVIGPVERYYEADMVGMGYTDPGYSLFPLGSTASAIINRNAWVTYTNGPDLDADFGAFGGFLRGEFKLINPASTSAGTNNLSNLTDGGLTYSQLATEGYWEFDPNGYSYFLGSNLPVTGGTYDVKLRANEFYSVPNHLNSRIVKSPDPHLQWEWDGVHGTITGTDPDYHISRTGMQGYSYFAIAFPPAPLSAQLMTASVSCQEGLLLNWTTMSELNSEHFEILSSRNGIDWQLEGVVSSTGNQIPQDYSFKLNTATEGVQYLKIVEVDVDGVMNELTVLSVNCIDEMALTTVPNPSVGSFDVVMTGLKAIESYSIELTDSKGTKLYETYRQTAGDNEVISIPDQLELGSGIYFIKVTLSNGRSISVRHLVL